jgi:trans-aconitate 2-methyltransferase
MTRWGTDVLARLPLRGDETVLDAGCGSGRVTERLCERLPRGRVIALDASPSMIAAARERLGRFGDRTVYLVSDLAAPLPLAAGAVDAVLSTAALHWVPDHDAVFSHLAVPLRPGGRLVAQCGGAGNIARVVEVLRTVGDGWPGPWTFATPDGTRARLEQSGFEAVETWLHDELARFADDATFREYLRTVVLGAHLERLRSDPERDAFVDAVAEGLPEREVAYVRLNILATRAG